ncbi:hypothetical protein INS49_013468 [Diaporthe citri]|uniref:uncharacterized protein n=1 Tax=Diaporthe citri TaxID=83186 RepID=UPI001C823212|nr:uncharacterized protein INS49_013468 [Diaporthe citri]KAG6357591.1 hypothetical protein INS49_013468 [Diaporthe citri]
MTNKYAYRSLPDEYSIRVLNLEPGKDDDQLSGALEVIHLHSPNPASDSDPSADSSTTRVTRWTPDKSYEAISYVWGSKKKDHAILLNGKTHQITANLSDALYQCRQTDQSRVLWADSICIDQEKLEEKNHQVYMMGRIYASSQRTLICLGTDRDNRDHARNALGVISDANRMIQEGFQRPDFSWELNSFPQALPEDPLVNDLRWQSVDILFSLPWFRRGWVVQEAALGREACVIWADYKIALMDVLRVQTWYNRRAQAANKSHCVGGYTSMLFPQIFFHKRKAEARVLFASENKIDDPNIPLALHHARNLYLSDPRDRIYAFMALPFVKNRLPALHPNYEQPHLEVYRDFAVKYLEKTSDLNILCYVTDEEVNEESIHGTLGSSWVPRWDCRAWNAPPSASFYRNFGRTSAEPAEFMIMRGEDDASAPLQVRAVIFDSIKLISRRIEDSMTIEDLIALWSLWSKQAGSAIASRQVEPSADNDSLKFLRALAGGLHLGRYEEWAEMLHSYSKFLQDSKQEDPLSPGSAQVSPDIQSCHRQLIGSGHHSQLFLLKRGYYGLGSWAIKQDDVCAFVFGVQIPIILHKVPDAGVHHYKVIGPAFVVSKGLDQLGIPHDLHRWGVWDNWHELCKLEGWTDWGLKEEKIILL